MKDAAAIDTNVPAVRARLRELPWLQALLEPSEADIRTLAAAWQLGATEWSNPHPLIDLMFGDRWASVRDVIADGIGSLRLTDRDRSSIRRRLVTANRGSCADAAAAIAELDAACRCGLAEAKATFVATSDERSPDVEVKRGDAELVIEAFGLQLAQPDREHADAQTAAFSSWSQREAPPAILEGAAFDLGDGLSVLRRSVRPLGQGRGAELVDRLARKLRVKANRGQLRGAAEGVLLVTTRHLFGVSSDDLDTRLDSQGGSQILHAALFGQVGDAIVETPHRPDGSLVLSLQREPGVLTVPGDARAILWLFHNGEARLAERSDAPLSRANRQLLVDAFGAVVLRSPSTISSNAE